MRMLWRSLALCGLALTLAPCAQAAEPIEGKTVYIDAGHGGEDSGAVGNELFEKDINLAVSEHVTDKLKAEGANPVASRSDDHFLTLEDRVAKASANHADLFVSIHVNSGVASASGTETYFQSDYEGENSRRLAADIQSQLVSSLQTRDRGVKESDFYVITYSQMPSVLAELGFITNSSDADKLGSEEYQQKAADAIVNGIDSYYEQ
ncbi:N-acetylmuramoyl-L-alanine amidase [Bacillus inaquosorum]|uniref:N-acetylmuramoyl-L-alanine amidase family protein n=1 Tax=Bacillus inaquosorum TaxID=483913 RepID=UPI0022816D5C|nr:N-acetylmuramoyl-L-alanine amidase [Bacillus inaquosorum]MCY7942338.1 N-acetylmuramoyl-L-alanine amidase [Bacillus inaquosorum]MCY7981928.1 N-acetylmuramoyl-L-alanine amidase [Bacillus inaquosorum]MCY8246685.1 N-acetylmuramoyl-L-alanine amidase [Bacillus inaquosorum]MCY8250567.1 N-acetylmuramoyl-L-alanine amidase [Bacillus inaquosorum]MCY8298507.1 N-acetylmuramoyl-L-alanine amidase [Bacillus inaquosorum]